MPSAPLPAVRRRFLFLPVVLAVLTLGACATVGDRGAPADAGLPPPATARQDLVGTIANVDHGNRRFLLDQGGSRADVAYGADTRLLHQGRPQPVQGLEPGDRIRLLASRDGALWRAEQIEVLQDAADPQATPDTTERSGAITQVDAQAREIGYNEGGYSGPARRVRYDSATVVEYRGQRHPVRALERGDLVRLFLRRSDRGWVAQRILVEVSASER